MLGRGDLKMNAVGSLGKDSGKPNNLKMLCVIKMKFSGKRAGTAT